MKLSIALFLSTLGLVTGTRPHPIFGKAGKTKSLKGELTADSSLGSKLLSKARRLDADEEVDYTWVAGYSLKFQGCFHVTQWNGEADGEEDVRIMTKRLVRFRLCPTDYCGSSDAGGCDSGYGDYIIDMNLYVESYIQAKQEAMEQACQDLEENVCGCDGDDRDDDEGCRYDCFVENNMEYCIEDEEDGEKFDEQEYMECAQFDVPDDDNNRRRLEDAEEEQYFIGPYCGNQGGDVYLGMFSEETCTEFVDSNAGAYTYKQLVGSSLPYSSKSLVGSECVSCLQVNDNDDDDAYEPSELCDMLYTSAGKCESNLADAEYPNENACNFMEGVKIIRQSGVVSTEETKASKTASAFIGIFAVSFCLLGGYVYYLKTKSDKVKINLTDSSM